MIEIDREKFVPISKLSIELNKITDRSVSENTVRKYLKDYAEFFNIVHSGQMFVELEPALKILNIIRNTISSGRNKGKQEVIQILRVNKFESGVSESDNCKVSNVKQSALSSPDKDWLVGIVKEIVSDALKER